MTAHQNLEELVLKLNEYYHDLVGNEYENLHPEIFNDEVKRWQRAGKKYLAGREENLRILDLGSGSGFVPARLAGFLKKEDVFICSDISREILDKCRGNMARRSLSCRLEYMKTDGRSITLQSGSVDVITMNSFLHHVHDLPGLYREITRLLRPGGLLLVGHEPNRPFFSHHFLWNNYTFLSRLQRGMRKLWFYKDAVIDGEHENAVHSRVFDCLNQKLLASGVITSPLSGQRISEIIDIQSCTAGGLHRDRPDLTASLKQELPGFKIVELETYHHLYKLSFVNRWTKWYDALLGKLFPESGALFFMAAKKRRRKK